MFLILEFLAALATLGVEARQLRTRSLLNQWVRERTAMMVRHVFLFDEAYANFSISNALDELSWLRRWQLGPFIKEFSHDTASTQAAALLILQQVRHLPPNSNIVLRVLRSVFFLPLPVAFIRSWILGRRLKSQLHSLDIPKDDMGLHQFMQDNQRSLGDRHAYQKTVEASA